jgi:CHAT domain-containing protein
VVHLSTHGRHNVAAPWFQALFVHPTPDPVASRVVAHEILDRDLEGLDLLSLSACETGLGRFDSSDNLSGLPAGLFLAGLRTLVGTLWMVSPEPAELFFTELHRGLSGGAGKLDAFAAAQREVRKRFDNISLAWGGFFLSGAWD